MCAVWNSTDDGLSNDGRNSSGHQITFWILSDYSCTAELTVPVINAIAMAVELSDTGSKEDKLLTIEGTLVEEECDAVANEAPDDPQKIVLQILEGTILRIELHRAEDNESEPGYTELEVDVDGVGHGEGIGSSQRR